MNTFSRTTLYNCLPNCDPSTIDWTQVAGFEVGGCTTETDENGDTWTNGGIADSEAEFWTVYVRYQGYGTFAGREAVTDCPTALAAQWVAYGLSALHHKSIGG